MDNEVTVLPEPDSPTTATVSQRFTSREIFLTAEVVPDAVIKSTLKFFISKRVVNGEG